MKEARDEHSRAQDVGTGPVKFGTRRNHNCRTPGGSWPRGCRTESASEALAAIRDNGAALCSSYFVVGRLILIIN